MTSKPILRKAGGKVWKDPSMVDWPEDDFRIFVGNLGTEVTDDILSAAFRVYKSFQKARVVRDNRTLKSKGFGFVSLGDPKDLLSALREVNGKYIGSRPCMLKRSKWEERSLAPSKSGGKKP